MTIKKTQNDYDEIKGLLSKIRKIQSTVNPHDYGLIKEQIAPETEADIDQSSEYDDTQTKESEDIAVINNVDVEIHSEDPEDMELSDDEKKKISQLIDDFYSEVSEIVEFDKLHIYPNSAKLDGKISDIDLTFSLSTGDDTGLYISNPSMLKIDDASLNVINKLRIFHGKYSNTINDLLVNRRTT